MRQNLCLVFIRCFVVADMSINLKEQYSKDHSLHNFINLRFSLPISSFASLIRCQFEEKRFCLSKVDTG